MGTKSKKKAKTRLDAYYRLAKDQGFRSRAAFKLIQLNRKYDFLSKSRVVVDLCAAPGGWCQVAAQFMPVGSKIVGIDLVPIAPIRGVKTFVGDITEDKSRKTIKTWLKKEPVDAVIHDGAPNVGGVWSKDLFAQNALVLSAAKMACDLLRPGGWFVTKVFRSPDYQKLIWVLKQLFDKVEATKPLASRMESAEIFVTCAGYKAPRQLDPKLFQAQHVFADAGEEKIMLPSGALALPKSNVPQGYEEFATIPTRVVALTDFLEARDAKALLLSQHEIRFVTPEEKALLKTRPCKPELVHLLYDLQQVGDADRRRLLRMREQLLRERTKRRIELAQKGLGPDGLPLPASAMRSGGAGGHVVGGDGEASDDDEWEDTSNAAADDEDNHEVDEIDSDAELDDMARQLLAIKRHEEKERKKKHKKTVDRKLKKVRGLINFDPNEANANAVAGMSDDDELGSDAGAGGRGGSGDDEDDLFGEGDGGLSELTAIQRLGRVNAKDLAAYMDRMAEDSIDSGKGQRIPNIPLNAINDVTLDPDDDMVNGALDGDEVLDVDTELAGVEAKKLKAAGRGRLDDDDAFDDGFDPSSMLLDEDEGLLDVDDMGNYVRAPKTSAVTEKFKVGRTAYADAMDKGGKGGSGGKKDKADKERKTPEELREEQLAREQEKKDRVQAKLDEVGDKKSKWERRHLNVEQVLKDTFAKPKAQKERSASAKARLEEDLVEMGDAAGGSASKKSDNKKSKEQEKKALRREVLAKRLHDESDDDTDYSAEGDDDSDGLGDLQDAYMESDEDFDNDGDGSEMGDEAAARLTRRMLRPDAVTSKHTNKNKFVPKQGTLTAQEQAKALRKQVEKDNKRKRKQQNQSTLGGSGKNKKETAFEEIPIAMTDPAVRARTLALATKMLDKKHRHEILEGGVHRYIHNDDDELPDWFVDDEQKHYKLQLPVTADEMEMQRQRFTELNNRPSKRVMEAVGRKRRKAQRMLRGMIEKGKTDPMMRNKTAGLSVRKLMRSKSVKGGGENAKKKKGPLDQKKRGEMRRDKQRVRKQQGGKGKGKGGRR